MSRTVDERVVSMKFDNKQFESNVQTSLSTMDKLKESLKFTGATKGLEDIDNASKKVNMSPLGGAVEQIGVKFNALQIMAVTALSNITNSAVNAGKRIVSAFTIDPIKTGLQEYETQINAVQTILANTESKGTTLTDVTAALDELNAYADKTIYNFTEMTRNIGTFTAAGVDLDTSTTAIQGIANLAAVSGSTSQQASTAMYQLSQALSSGTVKLMDWNSVVNAGMGGQVFQDALKETARNAGINIDSLIEKYGSFRETLQTGWLSADVLTETLSHFTMVVEGAEEGTEEYTKRWNELKASLKEKGYTEEQAENILKMSRTATDAATKVKTFTQLMDTLKESAQSGWTQTWEILIGDFEEAKSLWTTVSDVIGGMIGKSAEARNSMLQGWKDLGGRQMVIDSISNAFTGLMNILRPIGEAFREVFPATTSKQLLDATERVKGLTEKFKAFTENSENIEKIKSAFKGLFSIVSITVTVVKEVIAGVLTLASNLGDLLKGVLNITGSFGDWASGMRDAINESGFFSMVIGGLVAGIQKVIDVMKVVIGFLKEKIAAPGFQGFLTLMNGIWKVISWIGNKIVTIGKALGGALADVFKGADLGNLMAALNGGVFALILVEIKKVISGLKGAGDGAASIFENIKGTFENIKGIFGGLKDTLSSFQKDIQAKTLLKIASAVAILTASILVLSLIDPEKLTNALMSITVLFGELLGSMAIFSKIGDTKGAVKSSVVMIAMSTSVLILAAALKTISDIDTQGMITGVIGIAALAGIVVATSKLMSNGSGKAMKGATGLIMFALAVKVLASAVKDMSVLGWEEMGKGLLGVGALMTAVSLFLNNTKLSGKALTTCLGIVLLAASMKIFASAVKDFSGMSWEELGRGLLGMAAALLAVTVAVNFMPKNMVGIGIGLLAVSAALLIMASALTKMGSMSWEQLGIGLIALGGSLGLLAAGLHLMNGTVAGSAALMIASVALLMLASALTKMGGMSWEQLGIGLIALGGSLAILAIGLYAMTGTLAGSAALIVAALAIAILAPALLLLGSMGIGSVGVGLLAIAGAFTILGIAGAVLGPLVPAILGLSGAMALLGIGVLALGAGLILGATGLAALAAAFSASGIIIVEGITAILTGIIGLIPALAVAIGQGIIAICNVIAGAAGSICAAITAIIVAVANALIAATPPLVEAIFVVLNALLQKIVDFVPTLIDAAVKLVVAFLQGLADGLPKIIDAGVELILALIEGIASQAVAIIEGAFEAILTFVDGLGDAIEEYTPLIIEEAVDLGTAIIKGVIKGITSLPGAIWDGICDVGNAIKDGFCDFFGINSPSRVFTEYGKYLDEGLIVGLKSYAGKVGTATSDVGESALDSMSKSISGIANIIGSDIDAQPTIRPVVDLSAVTDGANSINGMFDMTPSIGVMSTIGAISSSMNGRQNGGNSDIISAIKDLGSNLGKSSGNTYQINGVTYDDGSNIIDAIEAIVREARIERRV